MLYGSTDKMSRKFFCITHTAIYLRIYTLGWLGSRVVSVLDSGAEGTRFKLQSRHCRVTVLGKLFTPIVPLFTSTLHTFSGPFSGTTRVSRYQKGKTNLPLFTKQQNW